MTTIFFQESVFCLLPCFFPVFPRVPWQKPCFYPASILLLSQSPESEKQGSRIEGKQAGKSRKKAGCFPWNPRRYWKEAGKQAFSGLKKK
ncbi:hypothetical protein [Methylomagnum ishizawai]|uniref:hypothetical protein n=1 Tax=Methylomagnum ishizawai TaxID=1760988 RepID=UPI000F739259|nr:hypothetical protein [Methylomagnum ishizawai]